MKRWASRLLARRRHRGRRFLGAVKPVPLQKLVTSCCNLCVLNDDVIAKVTDSAYELGHDTARITAGEVVAAKILVASAVGQHVVDGGQDRGRDGDSSFFWTAACF